MEQDWRAKHLETQPYLRGVRFQRKQYRPPRPDWDHDHCVACWAKFAEIPEGDEPVQHDGYTTCADYQHGAEYDWVCPQCFADFKELMHWKEASDPHAP